jgi:hypothetical protein
VVVERGFALETNREAAEGERKKKTVVAAGVKV